MTNAIQANVELYLAATPIEVLMTQVNELNVDFQLYRNQLKQDLIGIAVTVAGLVVVNLGTWFIQAGIWPNLMLGIALIGCTLKAKSTSGKLAVVMQAQTAVLEAIKVRVAVNKLGIVEAELAVKKDYSYA